MNIPKKILGGKHSDERGELLFNNDFDASQVKRMYIIEHKKSNFVRGWQGHKIEQRWFSAIQGAFKINLIALDNWDTPSKDLIFYEYILKGSKFDVVHVPAGYVSSIQAIERESKLIVMSDYLLNEINDEYRFPINYFKKK